MSLVFGNTSSHQTIAAITATTTPQNATLPTGVAAGDVLVVSIQENSASKKVTTPTGYTAFISNTTQNHYWKVAGASESGPVIVASSTTNCVVQVLRFQCADQTTPINVSSTGTGGGGSNWSSPALTTTVDNCILVGGGGSSSGASDWLSGDEPASMTLISQTAGTNCWFGSAYEQLTTAGSVSARTPWENQVNSKVTFSFAVAPDTSKTIDSLDTPVRVGGTHNITTTGLGTLTTASTVGGKAIASASATGGDGTITLAGFTAGQTYPAMGTQAVIASDGTNMAAISRTLDTMTGWQYVVVSGLDTGEWSLGKAFGVGEVPLELHVIDDGTGVLNADGTLTDWPDSGTFTCWARMDSGGGFSEGEMTSFTFTVTTGGIEIGAGLTSAGMVSRGIASSGLTS